MLASLLGQVIDEEVVGHRFEPGAKTLAWVVAELRQFLDEADEHRLGDVLGVGRLQLQGQALREDARLVAGDELPPGGGVPGLVVQSAQQGDTRGFAFL